MRTFIEALSQTDPIELTGIILSMIYLYLEIRAKTLMWFFGIISSLLMAIVFFKFAFYADMGLMIYYVIISIYGWIHWNSNKTQSIVHELPIVRISKRQFIIGVLILVLGYFTLLQILLNAPEKIGLNASTYPYTDALTVAASIVATWMLAQKILEQWYIWIIVNTISTIMFAMKGLNYTTILYVVYTIGSIIGYINWLKNYRTQKEVEHA